MAQFSHFNPGRLDKIIEIVSITSSAPDEDGFETEGSEETILRCHAQISDESGAKALASGSEFSVMKRRFLIRWTDIKITTDMYVRYTGEDYAIIRPPDTYGDSRQFIEIWTEQKKRV